MTAFKRCIAAYLAASLLIGCTHKNTAPMGTQTTMRAPSEKEMMENWKRVSTPGMDHASLKKLEGSWTATTTMWMDPNAKPEVSKGTATNKMVLGGRFLQQTYKGKAMGMPFEGMGLVGYDNLTGEYISTWADNMSTAFMLSRGSRVGEGKNLEMQGSFYCPMDNRLHATREITKVINNNKYAFEMYDRTADGREYKSMEIVYTRK